MKIVPSRHIAVPLLALAFQAVPWLGFHLIARSVHTDPPLLTIEPEQPVTLGLLAFSALGSLLLGSIGAYGLLRHTRLRIALPMLTLCCLPALVGGSLYLHGLLVFLAMV